MKSRSSYLIMEGPSKYFHNPFEYIFDKKLEELEGSLSLIRDIIVNRITIKERNIYELEKEIINARTIALNINPFNSYNHFVFDHFESLRIGFERDVIGLEREKRQEDVSAWRDIILLKNDLIAIMKDISRATNRKGLIERMRETEREDKIEP